GRNRYTRVWAARGGGLRRAALITGLVVVLLGAGGAAGYWSVRRAEGLRGAALQAAAIGASVAPPAAADVAPLALTQSAPAGRTETGLGQAPAALSGLWALRDEEPPAVDSQRRLLARLLALWGVPGTADGGIMTPPWPPTADGSLDIAAVAARYDLAATYLPTTTLADLRALGLPPLVELADA